MRKLERTDTAKASAAVSKAQLKSYGGVEREAFNIKQATAAARGENCWRKLSTYTNAQPSSRDGAARAKKLAVWLEFQPTAEALSAARGGGEASVCSVRPADALAALRRSSLF